MTAIAASGGQVMFIPKDGNSYFYESFNCQQAVTDGYGGIQFTVSGPAGGSFALELQSTDNCANGNATYRSSYNIIGNLTGQLQTVNVPLDGFDNDPNYDAIVGLVWSGFSQNGIQWSIGNITFVCGTVASSPPSTTSVSTRSTIPPTTVPTTSPPATTSPAGKCSNLLIDDWESQSRLTFLGYNAMNQASSDDGTMASIVVSGHRVMLTPKDTDSYFYSEFGCLNVNTTYGGIAFRIRAARGTTFDVTMGYTTSCGANSSDPKTVTLTSAQLKWNFDGIERLYWFPFSVFKGIDTTKLYMIYFSNFNAPVIFGPMSFYCGSTASEYVVPATPPGSPAITRSAVSEPAPDAKGFVIDNFANQDTNALGEWHGIDEDGMTVTFGNNRMTISANDSDASWDTQLSSKCADLSAYAGAYLHIAYSGSNKFTVSLQQHNAQCNESMQPFPETWDSLEAARYASASDIYMPLSHFNVNLTRLVPSKLASGRLVFACTRPDSFAFAIDDGDPQLAPRVMEIVKQADIPVTFFTVGLPLLDPSSGLADIYKEMASRGHQIALHSYTHPKMEGLPDTASIDWEYNNDIGATKQVFGASNRAVHLNYFRPPFGTEGARMRQRLAANLDDPNPYIIQWSVDVEDWLWAMTDTPGKQLDAFKRDVAKGGNLVVMHYLYNSTVELLPEFIKVAKATGKRLMRVDQCLEDPRAPPLS
ncbi:carbohydrate esterase family 4 protein [Thermothielavioides terrestris NRRL 8126]|uniref:Carbohydrate esterase family 4 protein n=1 Tax=Thermothielavioides terrestris (strain ATCC 38088 / NRRL 8126) TaxID=578455 RepID=G2RE92_THETT|nr:carbohydrate esterase family 4 protein [Thermothielavioides terrestris NRRL 8126]AEO70921.1 carbohydrate esterase family 4 protein [Thermothielavioides terrestris NRRL 8126]